MNCKNIATPRIYVAATRQNDGKTTASIGLMGILSSKFNRLGFIKPVGQRYVEIDGHRIDADAVLMREAYKCENELSDMSPLAVDRKFTRRYIDDPTPEILEKNICNAFDKVAENKDIVLIEGTGHAGVGAVFDLDNGKVAALCHAPAIIVACGGIGKPFDEISLNKAVFDKHNVRVAGVIVNKVRPDKIDQVTSYMQRALKRIGLHLLAVIPQRPQLLWPTIRHVFDTIECELLNGEDHINNKIHEIIIGAMTPHHALHYFKKGSLVITPGDRDDLVLTAVSLASTTSDNIAGLVLTGGVHPRKSVLRVIQKTDIPVLLSKSDTYNVASKIHDMMVKIKPEETDKIKMVQQVYNKHFDIDKLLEVL